MTKSEFKNRMSNLGLEMETESDINILFDLLEDEIGVEFDEEKTPFSLKDLHSIKGRIKVVSTLTNSILRDVEDLIKKV